MVSLSTHAPSYRLARTEARDRLELATDRRFRTCWLVQLQRPVRAGHTRWITNGSQQLDPGQIRRGRAGTAEAVSFPVGP